MNDDSDDADGDGEPARLHSKTRRRTHIASGEWNVPALLIALVLTVVPLALLSISSRALFLQILYIIFSLFAFLVYAFQFGVFAWRLLLSDDPVTSSRRLTFAKLLDLLLAGVFTFAAVLLLFWVLDGEPNRDAQLSGMGSPDTPWRAWVRALQYVIGGRSGVRTLSATARLYDCLIQFASLVYVFLATAATTVIVFLRVQNHYYEQKQTRKRDQMSFTGTTV